MKPDKHRQLYGLLSALRERVITDQQFAELERMIQTDPEAGKAYIRYIKLWTDLRFFQEASQNAESEPLPFKMLQEPEACTDSAIWKALAESEKSAPALPVPPCRKAISMSADSSDTPNGRPVNRKAAWISITATAAAILCIVLFGRFAPPRMSSYATLIDSVDARWSYSQKPTGDDTRFQTGIQYALANNGFAKILFDNHVMVTLEGPAEFEILACDMMRLTHGRLYATVSPDGYGFVVCTPQSKIIDLGTEFGVDQRLFGNTELHVVKGKTCLISRSTSGKIDIDVSEGSALRLNTALGQVTEIPCQSQRFVRNIDSVRHFIWRGQMQIDLADIVGGGNGFGTGNSASGIQWENGRVKPTGFELGGVYPSGFVPTSDSPFIDGVFVPHLHQGCPVISTTGLEFNDCPETSGEAFVAVNNGIAALPMTLANVRYGTAENPAIIMHANAGITFDLDALRNAYDDFLINGFNVRCGLADQKNESFSPQTDVWVLIDGQLQSHLTAMKPGNVEDIFVPIVQSDRFLTLIATESGDEERPDQWFHRPTLGDWCILGKPSLAFIKK